jgi:phosphoketolase
MMRSSDLRRKTASAKYLLASRVWRQDRSGFTYQDSDFIDHVANEKAEVLRVCLARDHKEEGTITTPFDMAVLNELDRFHLVMDVADRLPQTGDKGVCQKEHLEDKPIEGAEVRELRAYSARQQRHVAVPGEPDLREAGRCRGRKRGERL